MNIEQFKIELIDEVNLLINTYEIANTEKQRLMNLILSYKDSVYNHIISDSDTVDDGEYYIPVNFYNKGQWRPRFKYYKKDGMLISFYITFKGVYEPTP